MANLVYRKHCACKIRCKLKNVKNLIFTKQIRLKRDRYPQLCMKNNVCPVLQSTMSFHAKLGIQNHKLCLSLCISQFFLTLTKRRNLLNFATIMSLKLVLKEHYWSDGDSDELLCGLFLVGALASPFSGSNCIQNVGRSLGQVLFVVQVLKEIPDTSRFWWEWWLLW